MINGNQWEHQGSASHCFARAGPPLSGVGSFHRIASGDVTLSRAADGKGIFSTEGYLNLEYLQLKKKKKRTHCCKKCLIVK